MNRSESEGGDERTAATPVRRRPPTRSALWTWVIAAAVVAAVVAVVVLVPPLDTLSTRGSSVRSDVPPPAARDLDRWPDATNTGVAGCPPLTRVDGPEVRLERDGTVYENMEVHDAVIRVLANDVTIRCVKVLGTGYFGIDNTDNTDPKPTRTNLVVDRVEVDCRDRGVGLLVRSATVSRADVHDCSDMVRVGGDHVVVQDSFCHDLAQVAGEDIHADCIQSPGGIVDLEVRHNSLWGWDTSDILLGQDGGEAADVMIDGNRLLSDPDRPPPAYLLYVSGANTKVTNNRFARRSAYGPCTRTTDPTNVTWTGNVWDDDGSPLPFTECG